MVESNTEISTTYVLNKWDTRGLHKKLAKITKIVKKYIEIAYLCLMPGLMQKVSETIYLSQIGFISKVEGHKRISMPYLLNNGDTHTHGNKSANITRMCVKWCDDAAHFYMAPSLMQNISWTIKSNYAKFWFMVVSHMEIITTYLLNKWNAKWLENKFNKTTKK